MSSLLSLFIGGLGLTAGMTAIEIGGSNFRINLFSFLLAISVCLAIIHNRQIVIENNKYDKKLLLYYSVAVFFAILGLIIYRGIWQGASARALFTTLLGEVGFVLFLPFSQRSKLSANFIAGLKVNCLIQSIWAILQFTLFTILRIPLNYRLGLANASSRMDVAHQVTGLGNERAQFCLLLLIGIIITKSTFIKIIFSIAIILTESRSGIIMLIVLAIFSIDKSKIKKELHNITRIKLVRNLLIVVGMVIVFYYIAPFVLNLRARFDDISTDASGMRHLSYYTRLPELVMDKVKIYTSLLGYGLAKSGYPYALYYGTRGITGLTNAWSVESSWVNIFWESGIIGFLFWLNWIIYAIKQSFSIDRKIFGLYVSVLIGGIFYQLFPNFITISLIMVTNYYSTQKFHS